MNKRQYKKLYSDLPSKKYLLDKQVKDYKRRRARLNDISYRYFGCLYKMRKAYANLRIVADIVNGYQDRLYTFGGDIKHE